MTASPDDLCVALFERDLVLRPDGTLPRVADLAPAPMLATGTLAGKAVWAVELDAVPDTLVRVSWLAATARLAPAAVSAAARGVHVVRWNTVNRFCGRCAGPMDPMGRWLGRRCPACDRIESIKPQPVAILAICRDGAAGREVLLARHTYGLPVWALIGGWVDAGETFEETVARESVEEVGIAVASARYFGSEAWGFSGPGTLLTAFIGEAVDQRAEPIVDGRELAEAAYFPVRALPDPLPPAHSIAGRLLASLRPGR